MSGLMISGSDLLLARADGKQIPRVRKSGTRNDSTQKVLALVVVSMSL